MTTAVEVHAPITAAHRCDQCGAPAMVRATLKTGELYFCGHHGRDAGKTLTNQSVEIYDPENVMRHGK
jgi:hypothetical protein